MAKGEAPVSPVEVVSVNSIDELVKSLPHKSTYFTLLLAWDAPPFPEPIPVEKLRPLVDHGLVYFCSWGDRCEEVHDAIDHCDIDRMKKPGSEDDVIMTTWHSKETLDEAFWFFSNLALPSDESKWGNLDRFAAAVGNREWAERMERAVTRTENEAPSS